MPRGEPDRGVNKRERGAVGVTAEASGKTLVFTPAE